MAEGNGRALRNIRSSQDLWVFLSGSSIRSDDVIRTELEQNLERIRHGVCTFKKPNELSAEKLKSDKNIGSEQLGFLVKLSKFLDLEEVETHSLFCTFLLSEFHDTDVALKNVIGNERLSCSLMQQIWNWYLSERLHSLLCLKKIVTHWDDENHYHHDFFQYFFKNEGRGSELLSSVIKQLEQVTDECQPSLEKQGPLMKEAQVRKWAVFNLKEQCELLQILLLILRDIDCPASTFLKLAKLFKKWGFGRKPVNSAFLDSGSAEVLNAISYCQITILIQNLELQSLLPTADEDYNADKYYLVQDGELYEELDKLLTRLGTQEEHGPLLLAWVIVKSLLAINGPDDARTVKRKLSRLKPFAYLRSVLDSSVFAGDSVVAVVGHTVVYELLLALVNVFTEDSIGSRQDLCALANRVLRHPNISADFWLTGLESGLGLLLPTAAEPFPDHVTSLMKMSIALSSSGSDSASKVFHFLETIPTLTKTAETSVVYDRVADAGDGNVYLLQPYLPYGQGGICLPLGTSGSLLPVSDGDPVVKWTFRTNAWHVWKSHVQYHLEYNLSGVGVIGEGPCGFLTDLAKLVSRMAAADPRLVTRMAPLVELLLAVMQRFSIMVSTPAQLVSAFVTMAGELSRNYLTEIWPKITSTGLLPYFTKDSSDNTGFNGLKLNEGIVGSILSAQEKVTGQYPVTVSLIELATVVTEALSALSCKDHLACVVYVVRELFPNYAKWHFAERGGREKFGQLCVKLFVRVLNVPGKSRAQEMVINAALHWDVWQDLLATVSVGEEKLQEIPLWSVGHESEVVTLVRLSLALLVRLLLVTPRKSTNGNVSALEAAICGVPRCILSVAKYVKYRGDVRIATLAVIFMKRVAEKLSLSLLACLGTEAKAVQETLVRRLASDAEDPGLRTAILQLLTVCAERQAGLADMFLQVDSQGKSPCLECIGEILRHHDMKLGFCTRELHEATVGFAHSLWFWRWKMASGFLEKRTNFWGNLCSPLVDPDEDKAQPLKANAYILKILAVEIFHKQGELSTELKGTVQKVASNENLMSWPEVASGYLNGDERGLADLLMALNSWKEFYTIISQKKALEITASQRDMLVHKLLDGLQILIGSTNENAAACVAVAGDGLLLLMHVWRRCEFPISPDWGNHLGKILMSLSTKLDTIPVSAATSILASLMTYLRLVHSKICSADSAMSLDEWIAPACSFPMACIQNGNLEKNNFRQVFLVCLGLMKELVVSTQNPQIWIQYLKHSPLVPGLIRMLAPCLADDRKHVDVVESIVALFVVIGEQPEMSDLVANSGIVDELCLPIFSAARDEDDRTRLRVFNSAVRLMTVLVRVQGCKFIEKAIDFTCVHQEMIIQVLQLVRNNLDADLLTGVEVNLTLIQQMMLQWQRWKLYHRQSLEISASLVCKVCYIMVSLLLRATFVQHLVEGGAKSSRADTAAQRVRRFSSTDEVEKPSPAFMETQSSLFYVTALCISTLSSCSPEIQELLSDRACFSHEWNPVLDMSFGTPSLDEDGPICFGTLISCINVCVRALAKGDKFASPARGLSAESKLPCNRKLVKFILEKTTAVVIGQAVLYLLNPNVDGRGKQFIQREIGAELGNSLRSVRRSSSLISPRGGLPSPGSSQAKVSSTNHVAFIAFMNNLVEKMFKYA